MSKEDAAEDLHNKMVAFLKQENSLLKMEIFSCKAKVLKVTQIPKLTDTAKN
jgi:hypothetical protein